MISYDLIVIGGGPGGYVAAIRAAKDGKKTAIVEADQFGGTCLNRGCIPSKTLLKHAEVIEQIEKAKEWGIHTSETTFDVAKMIERKNNVISTLQQGIRSLLRAANVEVYHGFGKVYPKKRVVVEQKGTATELKAKNIIIATGSRPIVPDIPGLDSVSYHTTDTIFDLENIPESLVIIGGGVIGVEMAEIFSSLRTKVTVIERSERIIPMEDETAANALAKALKKKGVTFLCGHEVMEFERGRSGRTKVIVVNRDKERTTIETDEVLIAIGRQPNLDAIEHLNLTMNGPFIQVDDYLETSERGVFAVGDVIGNWQLAHVASSEGLTAVGNLNGPKQKMDYSVIPRCIYTSPQVACVGMTEEEMKKRKLKYKVHQFNFLANGMALANGETDGFAKIMIDETYGEILGVVMVGANVTEIIGQASAFMYLEGTVDELAAMVQPHPSRSEALMESANSLIGKGIHTVR